jgi:hypothetical protein
MLAWLLKDLSSNSAYVVLSPLGLEHVTSSVISVDLSSLICGIKEWSQTYREGSSVD